MNNSYPIVFNSNVNTYNIITSGKINIIDKVTHEIKNFTKIIDYSPPFFLSYFKDRNYYLFLGNNYYHLTLNENSEFKSLTYENKLNTSFILTNILSSKPDSIGYIKEKENYYWVQNYKNLWSQIEEDELVFYIKIENNIYFYYIEENKNYQLNIINIEDHISCKLLYSAKYICSFIEGTKVKIGIIILSYTDKSGINKKISCNSLTEIPRFSNHDIAVLNDISESNKIKILCARNIISKLFECCFVEENYDYDYYYYYYYPYVKDSNISTYYESLSFKVDNCYFTGFYSEYLFCCGGENNINCYRINEKFNYINHFQIEMPGINNYLTIINNNDYASLFYMNKISNKTSIYEYFIYPPKCNNISEEIIIFHEYKRNLNEFFDRKDYINYNITFENLPIKYGTIKLNETNINSSNYSIDLGNENIYFYFIPENITLERFSFNFNISIKETYSEKCKIEFKIKPCFESCLKCSKSNESSSIEEHNCLSCKDNFYPFSQKKTNCYNKSNINWYFNETNKIFDICSEKCKTCSGPTEKDCLSCHNDENNNTLYLYNGSCINRSEDSTEIKETSTIANSIESEIFSNIKDSLFIEDEIENTHTNENSLEKENYEEELENEIEETIINYEFIECNKGCLNCIKGYENNSTNCIQCDTKNGYYPIYGEDNSNCFNNETIKLGYYLNKDNDSYIWNKCYEKCETCNSGGDDINMNCLSCKSYLINNSSNKLFFELLNDGNCIEKCLNNTFMTLNKDCVLICPNNTYKFSVNHSCLNTCPNGYKINELKNECMIKTNDQTETVDEFKNQILSNISNFVNSSKLFNGSNFLAVVLSSDNMKPEDQIKMGISAVDLGNCTEVLKEHYKISKEENLIILNVESKKEESKKNESNDNSFNLGKNTRLEVYDFSGRPLDLSVCKEDIKVLKYIGDSVEELNIQSAKDLSDKGVDVFNPQDNFFNDICHPYNTEGKDIILTDRRTDLYQNATFCENGCIYTGMNYNLMVANCICNSNILHKEELNITNNENKEKSEAVNFNTITKSFIESLFVFNYKVIFCYNLILDIQYLIKNFGFYSLFGMFLLQIIFFFIYLCKRLKSIKYFMLIFDKTKDNYIDNKKNKKLNYKILSNKKNKQISNDINIDRSKTINVSNKNKEKQIKHPPPKNDKNSMKISLNIISKQNKSITHIKNESKNKRKKLKLNMKNNEDVISKSKDSINNSKNKNRINTENDSNNIDNILEGDIQSNYLNFSIYNKSKMNLKRKYISRNYSSTQGAQSSTMNVENKERKNHGSNKKILIESSEREEIFSKKHTKSIILKNNEINDNNDKMYNIRSNRQKYLKRNKLNKNSKILGKNFSFMETTAGKKDMKIKNKKRDEDMMKLYQSDFDIQDMDYEEAIIYDQRSYLRMYWSFLVDTQIILGTFCTDNYLNLLVIKLSFFIFTFQISFFLNAFFYTDEYVSNAYHNDGVLDFFSGLPKSIYSFVATLITTNLLKMLSNSQSELKKVIREKGKFSNYKKIINFKLSKLKKKLIVYFILVFLLETFFLYYVTVFCAVYKYSQKYWLIGCLESFAMDSLVALIICIFLSLFRYISIKKHIKYFYILANIIGTFL